MQIEEVDDSRNPSAAQPPVVLSRREYVFIGIAAVTFGSSAGIPYMTPAFNAGGGNYGWGITFATSTVMVYAGSASWGWLNMLTEIAHKSRASQESFSFTRALISSVLAAGAGTINYFNVKRTNTSPVYPVLAFVNWYGMDAYGYYKIISYLTSIKDPNARQRIESDCERILKTLILVFPVGQLIVNALIAEQAGEDLVQNKILALPFGLLALSEFALTLNSSLEEVQQIFIANELEASMTRHQALMAIILRCVMLLAVLFACSSDAYIAFQAVGYNTVGDTLAGLAIGGGFLLGAGVVRDLSNRGIMFFSTALPSSQAAVMEVDADKDDEKTALLIVPTRYT